VIVLFLHVRDADGVRALLDRAGYAPLVRQIDQQAPLERCLPTDGPPVLSIRYDGGPAEDVFDETVADAMYRAMQRAFATTRSKQRTKGAIR